MARMMRKGVEIVLESFINESREKDTDVILFHDDNYYHHLYYSVLTLEKNPNPILKINGKNISRKAVLKILRKNPLVKDEIRFRKYIPCFSSKWNGLIGRFVESYGYDKYCEIKEDLLEFLDREAKKLPRRSYFSLWSPFIGLVDMNLDEDSIIIDVENAPNRQKIIYKIHP